MLSTKKKVNTSGNTSLPRNTKKFKPNKKTFWDWYGGFEYFAPGVLFKSSGFFPPEHCRHVGYVSPDPIMSPTLSSNTFLFSLVKIED